MEGYKTYRVIHNQKEAEDTHVIRVKPEKQDFFSFLPGQYVFIKNPQYTKNPEEPHPFSIASSPQNPDYLEFCIKTYGDWTQQIADLPLDSLLYISKPQGQFVWDNSVSYAVFLLGGIGIAPVMSMLRTIQDTKQNPRLTLLYGNRTPATKAYAQELENLKKQLPALSLIDVYSDLESSDPFKGYRGFITADILQREVEFDQKPTFFIIGPPIFIQKMKEILFDFSIPSEYIKEELLIDKIDQKPHVSF